MERVDLEKMRDEAKDLIYDRAVEAFENDGEDYKKAVVEGMWHLKMVKEIIEDQYNVSLNEHWNDLIEEMK